MTSHRCAGSLSIGRSFVRCKAIQRSPIRRASPTTPRLRANRRPPWRHRSLQHERALRVVAPDDPRQLEIVESLSYELYLIGRIDDAITQRAVALRIYQAR